MASAFDVTRRQKESGNATPPKVQRGQQAQPRGKAKAARPPAKADVMPNKQGSSTPPSRNW